MAPNERKRTNKKRDSLSIKSIYGRNISNVQRTMRNKDQQMWINWIHTTAHNQNKPKIYTATASVYSSGVLSRARHHTKPGRQRKNSIIWKMKMVKWFRNRTACGQWERAPFQNYLFLFFSCSCMGSLYLRRICYILQAAPLNRHHHHLFFIFGVCAMCAFFKLNQFYI